MEIESSNECEYEKKKKRERGGANEENKTARRRSQQIYVHMVKGMRLNSIKRKPDGDSRNIAAATGAQRTYKFSTSTTININKCVCVHADAGWR